LWLQVGWKVCTCMSTSIVEKSTQVLYRKPKFVHGVCNGHYGFTLYVNVCCFIARFFTSPKNKLKMVEMWPFSGLVWAGPVLFSNRVHNFPCWQIQPLFSKAKLSDRRVNPFGGLWRIFVLQKGKIIKHSWHCRFCCPIVSFSVKGLLIPTQNVQWFRRRCLDFEPANRT